MLDIKLIREQPDFVKAGLTKKCRDPLLIDQILEIDVQRRQLIQKNDSLKAAKNQASSEIAQLQGPKKETAIKKMQDLSKKEKTLSGKLQKLEKQYQELMSQIPNLPLKAVPEGPDETHNQVIKTIGQKRHFDFAQRDHVSLGTNLDIIDIENAVAMSGTRFYYLKNEAVLLEFALVQHVLHKLVSKGFSPVVPPVLVKEEAMWATGFFPADRNEIYSVNPAEDKLFLVGTSEVPLTMLHADKIIDDTVKLPLRYCGFSSCFRREAGSYGKDTHGILRVHQFDKIEMFSFCHPKSSESEHEFILSIEEEIMQDLGFHYQVVLMCGGDLGNAAAKKYDIEVWIPTQNRFRELTSCSNCTDYQARRANIRFRDSEGQKQMIHTLNGTACAIGRTLIAILENYQNADGSVEIPKVLRPYLGQREKITPKNRP